VTTYTLKQHGEAIEQRMCDEFILAEFPSYEKLWVDRVIPLTNRPTDIHFKTNQEWRQGLRAQRLRRRERARRRIPGEGYCRDGWQGQDYRCRKERWQQRNLGLERPVQQVRARCEY
jgi:hypothetical protein